MRIAIDADCDQARRIMGAVNTANADHWCGHPPGRLMIEHAHLTRDGDRFSGVCKLSLHPGNDAGMATILDGDTVREYQIHRRVDFAEVFGLNPTILQEPRPQETTVQPWNREDENPRDEDWRITDEEE